MNLCDSGQVFVRCAESRCKWRLWLAPEALESNQVDDDRSRAKESCPQPPARLGRWRQQPANHAEVVHAAPRSLRRSKHNFGSWHAGDLQVNAHHVAEDSDEPLTSGEEAEEMEDTFATRQLELPSLEESWMRLKAAKPSEKLPSFQKRWKRNVMQSVDIATHAHDADEAIMLQRFASEEFLLTVSPDHM